MLNHPTIFLSHSTRDLDQVRMIRNLLEERGHIVSVFYFQHTMTQAFIEEFVQNEIKAIDWLVVALSEHARQSSWVQFERSYANLRKKPIFEVDLEPCAGLVQATLKACLEPQINRINRDLTIFISYTRRDSANFAVQLANDLRTEGYKSFLDVDILPGTASWATAIQENIDQAIERGFFLFLLSKGSLQSEWTQRELNYALAKGGRVIPCVVDPSVSTHELPPQLQRIQWVDFRNNYQEGLRVLKQALYNLSRS